jgi:hypothetical protein
MEVFSMNKVFGSFVASAVAGIVFSVPAFSEETAAPAEGAAPQKMACQNNSCKGKAACMGFGNAGCKGKNSCKGHGITKAKTEEACAKTHGIWTEKK